MLSTVLFLSWSCTNRTGQKEGNDQPNILFILLDDLGYSDLGCYGGEIRTPNIDALGHEGLRFESIYNSARCCPSRASLMTGLYPGQAGIADFTSSPKEGKGPAYLGHLREDCVTLGEVLRSAGYQTYYVGKWHLHHLTSPTLRGFDEFYGYDMGYAQDQWDPSKYIRLPEGREKEINRPEGEFYATDVFNEYALEFLHQADEKNRDQPWFLFLGHSSPHFPVQAPKETIDKYYEMYLEGWDVLREQRFDRMKEIGLIKDLERWTFTERSLVPVEKNDSIANGYGGQQNPAWNFLEADRQKDLARRMATFAAMVEHVDRGLGDIIAYLKETGQFENTLIMLTSDNGACYEWGPFGFDNGSRRKITKLHTGDELLEMGQPGTSHAYGSAWANFCNTPLRLYKHFTHEGGVASPFIVHWPEKIVNTRGTWSRETVHLIDIMPTLCEISGTEYPETFNGVSIQAREGLSLTGVFEGDNLEERSIFFSHQGAKAVIKGDWKVVWGKRLPYEISWELYNLEEDRCEVYDLSAEHPDKTRALSVEWEEYSRRVGL